MSVGDDHTGEAAIVVNAISLEPTALNSLFLHGGTSIVVHEKADDGKSDPQRRLGQSYCVRRDPAVMHKTQKQRMADRKSRVGWAETIAARSSGSNGTASVEFAYLFHGNGDHSGDIWASPKSVAQCAVSAAWISPARRW